MKIKDLRKENCKKATEFIKNLKEDVYILGTNKYGISLCQWLLINQIQVKGFINDFTKDEFFNNLLITKSSKNYKKSVIINCIVEGRTIDAEKSIDKLTPLKRSNYFLLQHTFKELVAVDFLIKTKKIFKNINKYQKVYNQLNDIISKKHYQDILNFRFNRDINFLEKFTFKIKEQYFEDFLSLGKSPTFVDAGGFDGETSILFTRKYTNYKKIFYFEPTQKSFEKSVENLNDLKNIKLFNKGIWNEEKRIYFDNSLGSANKITEKGNSFVDVVKLDKVIHEKVDFIKMDIEGAEYKAIKGAKKTIKRYKPNLAICIYHNQKDFLRIPKRILKYNKNYKLYIRHYTQGVFETVMYFINNETNEI